MKSCIAIVVFSLLSSLSMAQPSGSSPTGLVVGSGNYFSPIVADLDKATAFYRDGLGLNLQGSPADATDNLPIRNMFGLPDASIRWSIAQTPAMSGGVEIVEISEANEKVLQRRMQDTGAFTLIVFVQDIESTFERLLELEAPVVTNGGVPVEVPFGEETTLMVVVKDPDGHFVELVQSPEAQNDELPNVVDVRVRLTVEDLDQAMNLYGDMLGLEVVIQSDWSNDNAVTNAFGLSGAQYKFGVLQVPTSGLLFEVIEFKDIDRRSVLGNIQDAGSTRIQIQVNDIDAAISILEQQGGRVVSTDGVPIELPIPGSSIKIALVSDPSNLFIVLIHTPPAP